MIKTPREEAFELLGILKGIFSFISDKVDTESSYMFEQTIKSIEVYIIEQSCNCHVEK